MNQKTSIRRRGTGPARQRGITTLVIAILLLLVLSVVTALAVNVGIFEQRSAANEHRAQMVQTATEAAVNQAVEYLRANAGLLTNNKQNLSGGMNGWMFDPDEDLDTFRWQRCTTAYTPSGLDIDPCRALLIDPEGSATDPNNKIKNADDVALYDASYRFMSGGSPRLPLSEKFQGDAQLFDDIGGFDLAYETFATMCVLDLVPMDTGGAPVCSLNPERKGQTVITVMARARLGDEGADAELKQTVVTIGTGLNAPEVPIIASGSVGGLGSAQIIPNPNAGGIGVPLSVWSPEDVDIGSIHPGGVGAMRSCFWGEFLTTGDPEQYDGMTICDDCSCGDNTIEAFQLSGKDPSDPSEEGEDIQDVDSEVYGGDSSLPDATFFPLEPLDDDANAYDDTLFEYTFGQDVADEASVYKANCPDSKDLDQDGITTELIDCADAYLATVFRQITDCDELSPSSSGYLWVRGNCTIKKQVGTPSRPVVLVVDACMDIMGQAEIYGMLYIRGKVDCGNNGNLFPRGGGQIYGVVITEGDVKIRGSIQIIYSQDVVEAIKNTAGGSNFAVVPGSWSDSNIPGT